MAKLIHLQIVTAGGTVCDEVASYVGVPLTEADAGLLPGHAAMLGALKEGVVSYTVDGEKHYAAISGGVLSVAGSELIILARSAELAESIDLARAQASLERAKQRIAAKSENLDLRRAELSLHRALARIKASGYVRK